MLRTVIKFLVALVVLCAATFGVLVYHDHFGASRQLEKLQQEKQELQNVVQKLQSEKRVADLLVTRRQIINGLAITTLLFVEYDKNNQPLPARTFTVQGEMVHIDGLVIKFEHDFIRQNDPLRGHSIALFTRIYGDRQTPQSGAEIDEPNSVPPVYRDANANRTEFELTLWRNFWKLAADETYRAQYGVRIANGQGVWGPFEPDRLYTLTLESSGGLNLSSEPMKGIYRAALHQPPNPPSAAD